MRAITKGIKDWRYDKRIPTKMVGKAWVGVWNEPRHRLGWAVPYFVDDCSINGPLDEPWAKGTFWKCKVTIELMKDKLNRLSTKVIE